MPRPRKDDTRKHQLNIRFSAREFARVHHHAGLLGKTPADFGRSVMLRRPRRNRREAPVIIAVSERVLRRWHERGLMLNALAHRFNAGGEIPAPELASVVSALRRLIKASLPELTRSGRQHRPVHARTRAALSPAQDLHQPRADRRPLPRARPRAAAGALEPHLPLPRRAQRRQAAPWCLTSPATAAPFAAQAPIISTTSRTAANARPRTSDRVAFTAARNLANADPRAALDEMWRTAEDARHLKERAGLAPSGRKNDAPVKTVSLAWAPGQAPTREEMCRAADSFLKAMGWGEHQTLYIAHNDTRHAHLHLIINRVHPDTGRTLNDWQERKRAQKWALGYETEQGIVLCPARAARHDRAAKPPATGLPYRQAKLLTHHDPAQRKRIARQVRAAFRPAWAAHYRRQRAALATFDRHARDVERTAAALVRQGDSLRAMKVLDALGDRRAQLIQSFRRQRATLARSQDAALRDLLAADRQRSTATPTENRHGGHQGEGNSSPCKHAVSPRRIATLPPPRSLRLAPGSSRRLVRAWSGHPEPNAIGASRCALPPVSSCALRAPLRGRSRRAPAPKSPSSSRTAGPPSAACRPRSARPPPPPCTPSRRLRSRRGPSICSASCTRSSARNAPGIALALPLGASRVSAGAATPGPPPRTRWQHAERRTCRPAPQARHVPGLRR